MQLALDLDSSEGLAVKTLEKLPCPAMACRQLADRLALAQDM